jgi:WD40 repeat protein
MADLATVSPDGKTLVTALGRRLQRWDLATMSKIGESFDVPEDSRVFSHLEFADGGRVLVSHRTTNRSSAPDEARRVTYFAMGVRIPEQGEQGLPVLSVEPGTPAEAAGLLADDVILRLGHESVGSSAEFTKFVDEGADGIEVTFLRDGNEQTVPITPNPRIEENIRDQLADAFGEVRLWDLESGREVGELPIPLEGQTVDRSAAVAPDGRSVVTVGRFGQRAELRKFDTASGRPVAPSVKYPRPIRQIRYGPRG